MSIHEHREVTIRGKRRCADCTHRVAVDGIAPVETRKLVLAAGVRGVVVAYAELRDRRRARLVGRWTKEAA